MPHRLILLVALLSLSTSPLWVRMAGAHLVALGVWRLLGSSTLTLAWLGFRDRKALNKFWSAAQSPWGWLTGFFFFLHLWTYMQAVQTTSIAHMALIFASNPIFTAAGALLFFREKFQTKLLLVYGLALFGLFLLFKDESDKASSVSGDIAALISAALHAAYVLSGKQARRSLGNLEFTTLVYLVSGIMFLAWGLSQGISLTLPSENAVFAVVGLILFPTLLGHSLFNYLLNFSNINFLSCAKLLEPGLSTLMALIFLGEIMSPSGFVAYGFIASAVLILFWPNRKTRVHIEPLKGEP